MTLRSVHDETVEDHRKLQHQLWEKDPDLDTASAHLIAAMLLQIAALREIAETIEGVRVRL